MRKSIAIFLLSGAFVGAFAESVADFTKENLYENASKEELLQEIKELKSQVQELQKYKPADSQNNGKDLQDPQKEEPKPIKLSKSGIFLGVGVSGIGVRSGAGGESIHYGIVPITFRAGYQKYFGNFFGLRLYGESANGGDAKEQDENKEKQGKLNLHSINLDLLFDIKIPQTAMYFGLHGGISRHWLYHQNILEIRNVDSQREIEIKEKYRDVNFSINAGASLNVRNFHRFEASYRIFPAKFKGFSVSNSLSILYYYVF
ncbi:hypothetical protein CQA49_05630 [Helicobacter sp. MIT 00-7814]|uniref:outer membrane beta-barrel protein n=1 Tax=unclassified Helicobacter TaxID=2593540 RepID=UPI000E1E9AF5|nr:MULTISPECIES: outer membrane beta-barrel protein [unclassified Helicobacter]RDU53705.1 hypothetical protein CQA37_06775 [Helicobacter sp. MIT 99-10781]RDU54091.1 hypothetical protein CQA49_05630 [Helicobacter sp. MIT 00-7814]